MGDYITQSDIEDRFAAQDLIGLVDDEGSGVLDGTNIPRITAAITDAEGEANAILAQGGLAVPISPVPNRLVTLVAHMSWFYLHKRRGVISKQVQEDYDKARDDLVKVASTGATGDEDEPAMKTTRKPVRGAATRRFTRTTMEGL